MLRSFRLVPTVSSLNTISTTATISAITTVSSRSLYLAQKPDDHDIKLERIKKSKWTWNRANGPLKAHRGYTFDPSSFKRKAAEKMEKENEVGPDKLPLAKRLDEERSRDAENLEGRLAMRRQKAQMARMMTMNDRSSTNVMDNNSTPSSSFAQQQQQRNEKQEEQEVIRKVLESLPKEKFSQIDFHLANFPSEIRRKKLEEESEKNIEVATALSSSFFFSSSANNNNNTDNVITNNISSSLQLCEILTGTLWDLLRKLLSPQSQRMPQRAKEAAITDFISFGQSLGEELLKLQEMMMMNHFFLLSPVGENNNNVDHEMINAKMQLEALRLISNARLALYYDVFFTNTFASQFQQPISDIHYQLLKSLRDGDAASEGELFRDEMIFFFLENTFPNSSPSTSTSENNNHSNNNNRVIQFSDFDQFVAKFIEPVQCDDLITRSENLDIFALCLRHMLEEWQESYYHHHIDEKEQQQKQLTAFKTIFLNFASAIEDLTRQSFKKHREIQSQSKDRGFGTTPVDGVVLKTSIKTLCTILSPPFDRIEFSQPSEVSSFLRSTTKCLSSLEQLLDFTPNFELPTEGLVELGKSLNQTFLIMTEKEEVKEQQEQHSTKLTITNPEIPFVSEFLEEKLPSFFTNTLVHILARCETKFSSLKGETVLSIINEITASPQVLQSLQFQHGKSNNNEENSIAINSLKSQYGCVLRSSIHLLPSALSEVWILPPNTLHNKNNNDDDEALLSMMETLDEMRILLESMIAIHQATFHNYSKSSTLKMSLEVWRSMVNKYRSTMNSIRERVMSRNNSNNNNIGSKKNGGGVLTVEILHEYREGFAEGLMLLRRECVMDPYNKREHLPLSRQEKKLLVL